MLALIADHGLRPESADEAALTARRLAAHGIESWILTLSIPPGPALQARARQARHAALAHAAAKGGFLYLLLGHHAADQAETVAMRRLRGPGGAEGMAAWSARNGVVLLRPLLDMPPAGLRDYLRARGMEWVEDPSNQASRFERARIRAAGTGLAAPQGAAERMAREQAVAAYLAAHAQIHGEGFAVLDADTAPPAALGGLIRVIGGAAYPPRQAALAGLAARLRPATLGGVRLMPAGRFGPGWLLVREPAACAAPVPAEPGALWDGRFYLPAYADDPAWLGALGADVGKYRGHGGVPAVILRTLPCLRRREDGEIRFPIPALWAPPGPMAPHPFRA